MGIADGRATASIPSDECLSDESARGGAVEGGAVSDARAVVRTVCPYDRKRVSGDHVRGDMWVVICGLEDAVGAARWGPLRSTMGIANGRVVATICCDECISDEHARDDLIDARVTKTLTAMPHD
jgi:hypothetical protein